MPGMLMSDKMTTSVGWMLPVSNYSAGITEQLAMIFRIICGGSRSSRRRTRSPSPPTPRCQTIDRFEIANASRDPPGFFAYQVSSPEKGSVLGYKPHLVNLDPLGPKLRFYQRYKVVTTTANWLANSSLVK
jgi:hypothetical protein